MPLTGHFEWEEKKDHFVVKVPLKGVAPSKVDVFGNRCLYNTGSSHIFK